MNKEYGIPEVFYDEAFGLLRYVYDDIQCVLRVPIVNFIFRTLGLYEKFLAIGWENVRWNMLTINMEEAASSLRYPDISLNIPEIDWNNYYDTYTIEVIKKIIVTFNYVNPKLLIIANTWAEQLSGRYIVGDKPLKGYIQPGILSELPNIDLVKIPSAPMPIKSLLLDIAKKHQTYDAASDYRALANFPYFLNISWTYLKPYVGTNEYQLITSDLKAKGIAIAHSMPFPLTMTIDELEAIYSSKDIGGIMGVVSMFQSLLPALIIDGEFFRRIIL